MFNFFEKIRARQKREKRKLVAKAIMVGLGVVMFWRGTWNLFDYILFPNQPIFSALASLTLGLIILYVSNTLIDELL